MRKYLEPDKGVRKKFRAVFVRFGKKRNYHGYGADTVLLSNVVEAATKRVVTDHVWFSYTKGFEKIMLRSGLTLEFEARIKAYRKGYVNRRYKINRSSIDYKLSHPGKISVIGSWMSMIWLLGLW